MREFKIRIWDVKNNDWYYTVPGKPEDHNVLDTYYFEEVYQDEEHYIWEQYTGLKDKNGKEIYEGDIIKFADLELAMKPTGVVCFSDGKFFVKDWEFDDGSYHIVDFYDYNIPRRDFEVIGNIHENPELLGGEE